MSYVICPRCGLSIVERFRAQEVRHCPRCIAYRRMVVELFPSPLPSQALYAPDRIPRTDLSTPPTAALSAVEERATPAPPGVVSHARPPVRPLPRTGGSQPGRA
jgi:hypothetical protein